VDDRPSAVNEVKAKWGHGATNMGERFHHIFPVESDASRICEKFHKPRISAGKITPGALTTADFRRGSFHSVSQAGRFF
jgi:hypothetical protein